MRWGLRARLVFWHGIGLAVILAGTFAAADWLLRRSLSDQVDAALLALAETEAASALDSTTIHLHEHRGASGAPEFRTLDKLVQILDLDGRVIIRSVSLGDTTLPMSSILLSRIRNRETVLDTLQNFAGDPVRLVSMPIEEGGKVRYALQVATSLRPTRIFLATTRLLIIIVSFVLLAVVTVTGAILAKNTLRPIEAMVAMAQRVGETNLQERLPYPGTKDEIGHLVDTLNGMLDRLERSFAVQSRFTADAAHELRSPLSRLRAELEVALRRPRDLSEYRTVLLSCLEEVERLSRLTGDLLVLARLDAGERHGCKRESVLITTVVDRAVKRIQQEAQRKNVAIAIEPSAHLSVAVYDGSLEQVIANLLENAIKFSPSGSNITVRARSENDHVLLTVSDTGPGIPCNELPRVFERFYRGDTARSSEVPGVGLGLAICRGIVEAQGGSISVDGTSGAGTTVTVRLARAV
ncbi:MAG: HAMP domain-containing protein [Candidatus Methylomirabilis oxygeniifera]|uniref:histidine kinase n=1 Tax=Methylomirabilis oxygeniifera TaxID=671143 RepID=D5MLP2_METO1|nr:MAG: HAMP domain-containing protein [Candidatus Methylomirabilis oxyfera]CBE69949.1 Sensor protein [Candidatus Methylomirabilis oxyfera]